MKEKQIKDLLDRKIWLNQKQIRLKARQMQKAIGSEQHDDMNDYDDAIKTTGIKLEANEKKQITAAVSWRNPDAERVIKKIHKGKANPVYGLFKVDGKVIEYRGDGDCVIMKTSPLILPGRLTTSTKPTLSKRYSLMCRMPG